MRTKNIIQTICLVTVCFLLGSGLSVFADTDGAGQAQSIEEGILASRLSRDKAESTQEWLDSALSENAGMWAEWYVLALRQQGRYDFSAYRQGLTDYLNETQVYSASTRLKYALLLQAVGAEEALVSDLFEHAAGQQGIVSWVFALHLLNNGLESDTHSAESVIDTILAMKLADGGFALSGAYGDVDVTAMVLQALAPYVQTNEDVREAVEGALDFLSSKQQEDGDFSSYGVKNPESGAQVLMALSALSIDAMNDTRFMKNGNTVLDGIEKYCLENGEFSHTFGGKANENATSQVYLAMIDYLRMTESKGSVYLLDKESDLPKPPTSDPAPIPEEEKIPSAPTAPAPKPATDYRIPVSLVIAGLCAVGCILLAVLKKRHFKNFLALFIVGGLLILFVWVTDFQSAEDYYGNAPPAKEEIAGYVTLTIRCDAVAGKSDKSHIPADGVILQEVELPIEKGDTVYDILCDAARLYEIQIDNRGTDTMAYMAGIGYLYEFEFGDLSGWVYTVNGERASVGCGEYVLSDGDSICWEYTLDISNILSE